jgi:hypothetical protein
VYRVVALWGTPGAGKTTLANGVGSKVVIVKPFDTVPVDGPVVIDAITGAEQVRWLVEERIIDNVASGCMVMIDRHLPGAPRWGGRKALEQAIWTYGLPNYTVHNVTGEYGLMVARRSFQRLLLAPSRARLVR